MTLNLLTVSMKVHQCFIKHTDFLPVFIIDTAFWKVTD